MAPRLDALLTQAHAAGASDVHVTVGVPPQMRVQSIWTPLAEELLKPPECEEMARSLIGPENMEVVRRDRELDLSHSIAGVGRFRVNVFYQRGSVGLAIRLLPFEIPEFDALGLPVQIMQDLCKTPNGIVLVCGPTGSGKSTTLAAMVDHINQTLRAHIVTIEDPIEFLHAHKESIVDQREVGADTHSFRAAMRHVLRQSPDVVLVGEIRDPESVRTAIMLAETGHLVLSTIHAGEATQGISRITNMFSEDVRSEVRVSLAMVLRGMIVQQLLPSKDGTRILAYELLLSTTALGNLIRAGKYEQVHSLLQTHHDSGMRTMNLSLLELYKAGQITRETALSRSIRGKELETLMDEPKATTSTSPSSVAGKRWGRARLP